MSGRIISPRAFLPSRGIPCNGVQVQKAAAKIQQQHEFTGFLDKGVRFEGTLEATGVFRIDAQLKGNVISTHSLILGEGARVEGQIEGNHVVIAGKFDGVIFAKGRVEIQAKGVVTGRNPFPVPGDRAGRDLRWPVPHAGGIGVHQAADDSDPCRPVKNSACRGARL